MRHRLADDGRAADDDGARALERDLVLVEHPHDPERRARDERRAAEVEPARVDRVDAVDVLRRGRSPRSPRFSSMWSGSGSWTSRPSTSSSALSSAIVARRSSSRRVGGESMVARLHPGLLRRLLLQVDVDVRGGVVADEDGGERRRGRARRPRRPLPRAPCAPRALPSMSVAVTRARLPVASRALTAAPSAGASSESARSSVVSARQPVEIRVEACGRRTRARRQSSSTPLLPSARSGAGSATMFESVQASARAAAGRAATTCSAPSAMIRKQPRARAMRRRADARPAPRPPSSGMWTARKPSRRPRTGAARAAQTAADTQARPTSPSAGRACRARRSRRACRGRVPQGRPRLLVGEARAACKRAPRGSARERPDGWSSGSASSSKRSSTRLRTMPRLPRKNDPDSVRKRQEALGLPRGRPGALGEGRRVGDRARLDPRLRRAARRLARRVRAVRGRRGRRDRTRRRGGRRPARAHRGRADGVGAARREGDRGVGRLPNVRGRRQNHPSILLRLQGRRRRARRSRAGSRAQVPAMREFLRERRQSRALALRGPARGEDARRRADVPRPLALDDRRRVRRRT